MAKTYTPKPKPLSFFLTRVGKRIYRDSQGKCCRACDYITKNGLVIYDELHATHLADIDAEFANEGIFSRYRDNI